MPDTPRLSPLAAQGSEVNRSGELEVLVLVAEQGSLSAAARQLGVSPSAISKTMSRLEARLGMQLLQRSTRRMQLTAEGAQLVERGKRLLADLDELEATVAARSAPKGVVRISASTSTGQRLLVPLVAPLMAAHPGLRLELFFTDQIVDLVEDSIDIAIRWGQLPSSDMVARRLGCTRQVIVAAPDYLARHGVPQHPKDLADHRRMGWTYPRAIPHWPFLVQGQRMAVEIGQALRVNDGDVLRGLALGGAGLARLSLFHAWEDLQAGRLEVVLEDFNTGDLEPIHAVYPGKPDRLPPRTRAVLDFLQAHVDLAHAEQLPAAWRA
ncbi:LysR family transcriptional regulator [Comamonas aquatica]|uniref:LysR family transcriptional regulator n=1 Tax=Comamonas aquatica TaxID=225991 RepID=UPI0024499860|nr:LysR family transcriptional regulator [Comamonas aquatica]MDH0200245.1 LysR family transcriptional regulator [Comamonas aquatica]MDH1445265.1 LysR family transcriptional regulator [Comamonas aquatica]